MQRNYRVTPLWVGGPRDGQVVTIETPADLPDWKLPLPSTPSSAAVRDARLDDVLFVLYRHGMLRTTWLVAESGQQVTLECRIAYAVYLRWSEVSLLNAWNATVALLMAWRGWPGPDEGERWIVRREAASGDS